MQYVFFPTVQKAVISSWDNVIFLKLNPNFSYRSLSDTYLETN